MSHFLCHKLYCVKILTCLSYSNLFATVNVLRIREYVVQFKALMNITLKICLCDYVIAYYYYYYYYYYY